MKNRIQLAVLVTLPALLCASAAQAQEALRPPPQPPTHNEDLSIELRSLPGGVAHAQRQVERQVNEVRHVIANVDRHTAGASTRMHALLGQTGPTHTSGQALVIRTRDLDPESQSQLEEDLHVMSRIVEKAAQSEPARGPRAMGIDLVFGPGGSPVRSLYLDGYGALFMVDVNFPLLPLPSIETNLVENAKPATASTWEQARQELYGPPRPPEPMLGIAWTPEGRAEQAYNAEKVERLRQSLFEAIKNATNIRQLAADESVTITVIGSTVALSDVRVLQEKGFRPTSSAPARLEEIVVTRELNGNVRDITHAVMTLQAKKADVDRFARGEITLEQFRELARTQTYPGGRGWSTPDTLFWSDR